MRDPVGLGDGGVQRALAHLPRLGERDSSVVSRGNGEATGRWAEARFFSQNRRLEDGSQTPVVRALMSLDANNLIIDGLTQSKYYRARQTENTATPEKSLLAEKEKRECRAGGFGNVRSSGCMRVHGLLLARLLLRLLLIGRMPLPLHVAAAGALGQG